MRDPELLRGHDAFIAEGRLVVQRLFDQPRFHVRSVLVTPAALDALRDLLVPSPAEILVADAALLHDVTGFNLHRGCLALAERPAPFSLDDLLVVDGPVLVLEQVGNPDNVGGAFRNAAAFGASGVILSPGCSDPLYRKAIRTSMGATLSMPFTTALAWPEALDRLRQAEWSTIALHTSAPRELREVVGSVRGRRVAFVLGHEGAGLSEAAFGSCLEQARIPMGPGADSLNVATAAAVALYELRQHQPQ